MAPPQSSNYPLLKHLYRAQQTRASVNCRVSSTWEHSLQQQYSHHENPVWYAEIGSQLQYNYAMRTTAVA